MKKYFFLILLSIFLLVPVRAKALTLFDGSSLNYSNFLSYVEELGYDYWHDNIGSDYFALIPGGPTSKEFLIVKSDIYEPQKGISYSNYISCMNNYCGFIKVSYTADSIDFTSNYSSQVSISGGFDYSKVLSTFNLKSYDGSSYLFTNNFDSTPKIYTINFDIPNNVLLIVKDSDGNIVESENNTYHLEVGSYTYTITSELYETIEEAFVVSEEITIKPELISKFKTEDIDNIFTKFYTILKNMTLKIFNLEQPLFLIGAGLILVFAVVLLIKKILGGK